ncbi:uncharacterized protein LOC112091649 [Morus notabilis]|uniref:uncharacterized protein LOC112091649 n=1 Tax=Morus notabilis TaxID=981085 RepID=UPI000CED48AF|nr:uncharacterized protein LOC112091649 [Morus notabilis]
MTDREALMGALSSMKKNTPFKRDLNRKSPATYKEFLARAQGYNNAEEAEANDPEHRSKNKGTEQGLTSRKQDNQKQRGGRNGDKQVASASSHPEVRKPRQEENQKPHPFQRYDSYHELAVGVEKDEVERLIHEGRLQEFRADWRGHGQGNDGRCWEDNRRGENREPAGVIRTIHGGRATKIVKFGGAEVVFTEEDANEVHFPHNDALVVEAMIRNHTICRILVDNGSSVDILFSDYLKKMGILKE